MLDQSADSKSDQMNVLKDQRVQTTTRAAGWA